MSDDSDPHKLILAHVDDIAPPTWVSEAYDFNNDKTSHCYHCHEKFIPFVQFGRIAKHHCRLCGELVCRSCTSKLHVPVKFEKKVEKEHSRVCHSCLFNVLIKRAINGETSAPVMTRVMKYVWGGFEPESKEEKMKLLPRKFYVLAEWANVHDTANCFKCSMITEKRHHCRLCGLLFCGDCSQKVSDVPIRFDLKNKAGAQRVCDYCRFCLARGWRYARQGEVVETTSSYRKSIAERTSESSSSGPGYKFESVGSTQSMIQATVTAASVTSAANAYGKPRVSVVPPRPGAASSSSSSFSSSNGPPPITRPNGYVNGSGSAPPLPQGRAVPPSSSVITVGMIVSSPSNAATSLRPFSQCSVVSCSKSASSMSSGLCAEHEAENASIPKNTPAPHQILIRFRWEEDISAGINEPWSQVTTVGHGDLHIVNDLFLLTHPKIDGTKIQYVVRGRAVLKMHWRMFEARFMVPELVIKKTTPFDHKSLKASSSSNSNASASTSNASSVVNSPMSPPLPGRGGVDGMPLDRPRVPSRSPSPGRRDDVSSGYNSAGSNPASAAASPTLTPQTREQLLAQSKPSRSQAKASATSSAASVTSARASPNPSPSSSRNPSPSRSGPPATTPTAPPMAPSMAPVPRSFSLIVPSSGPSEPNGSPIESNTNGHTNHLMRPGFPMPLPPMMKTSSTPSQGGRPPIPPRSDNSSNSSTPQPSPPSSTHLPPQQRIPMMPNLSLSPGPLTASASSPPPMPSSLHSMNSNGGSGSNNNSYSAHFASPPAPVPVQSRAPPGPPPLKSTSTPPPAQPSFKSSSTPPPLPSSQPPPLSSSQPPPLPTSAPPPLTGRAPPPIPVSSGPPAIPGGARKWPTVNVIQ